MSVEILVGNCRTIPLPTESIDCIITSPSYWGVTDYGVEGQIGRATTIDAYIIELLACFGELHRVLRERGTLWFITGDMHPGLCGLPWMLAFSLQTHGGWQLHHDFVWHKPGHAHDYVFLLSKAVPYYLQVPDDIESVWTHPPGVPYPGALFEPVPTNLIENCIKWGCPRDGTVFNPFSGSGTVGVVARDLGYNAILMDLDPAAAALAANRLR